MDDDIDIDQFLAMEEMPAANDGDAPEDPEGQAQTSEFERVSEDLLAPDEIFPPELYRDG